MSTNVWTKYHKYINKLKGKNPDDIKPVVAEYFPELNCGTPAMCFHNSVKEMMKHKIDDAEGLNVLKQLYAIYTLIYPNLKTRKQKLSEVRKKVISIYQSEYLYKERHKED